MLKEISPEYSLERLMLKLKLQYFGHLMGRTDSLEKTLMLWKIEGGRRREWQDEMVGWHHRLNGHEFEQALGVGDGQGSLACCSPWGRKELDMTERLNWTDMKKTIYICVCITELLCYTVEINRMLWLRYTSIKSVKKKKRMTRLTRGSHSVFQPLSTWEPHHERRAGGNCPSSLLWL